MDDVQTASAEAFFKKSRSAGEITESDLAALAACHKTCFPRTSTAKAGTRALNRLYTALLKDPASLVIWKAGDPIVHEGAFASGTIDLKKTESLIARELPLSLLLRLMIQALFAPAHLLAMRSWGGLIRRKGIGYILTMGVTDGARTMNPLMRGRRLLAVMEDWFRMSGASESWVDTEIRNTVAVAFYTRMGYKVVSEKWGQVLLRKRL